MGRHFSKNIRPRTIQDYELLSGMNGIWYAETVGKRFIFMDDNAFPHRENMVKNWFEEVGTERME